MERHLAGNWMATVSVLQRLRWLLCFATNETAADEFQKNRREMCPWIKEEVDALPFSESLKLQAGRMLEEIRGVDSFTPVGTMRALTVIDEFLFNVQAELKANLFLVVPVERKKWFCEGDVPLFGQIVGDAFPESTPEVAEAGRCFALARWTACVFHLMRALELALHKWATDLGVTQFSAIELENWKNILDAADKKIRTLEQQPKSAAKDADLKYYSETLAHYRTFKDAWRNHVAHSRERYDEGRALSILNHTREFMTLLAGRP
jgi:hypothetical protein